MVVHQRLQLHIHGRMPQHRSVPVPPLMPTDRHTSARTVQHHARRGLIRRRSVHSEGVLGPRRHNHRGRATQNHVNNAFIKSNKRHAHGLRLRAAQRALSPARAAAFSRECDPVRRFATLRKRHGVPKVQRFRRRAQAHRKNSKFDHKCVWVWVWVWVRSDGYNSASRWGGDWLW